MRFGPFISSKLIAPTDAINARTDFTRYFAQSGKPAHLWAVGAEIELFGFTRDGLQRIDPDQVQAIINGFASQTISHVIEDGYVTEALIRKGEGVRGARGEEESARDAKMTTPSPLFPHQAVGRLTLEPGGQIEFSGAPARSLVEIERALSDYTKRLAEIGEENQVIFV